MAFWRIYSPRLRYAGRPLSAASGKEGEKNKILLTLFMRSIESDQAKQ